MTEISGCPAKLRSGSTAMRPARSTIGIGAGARKSRDLSGEAATPAAHTTVLQAIICSRPPTLTRTAVVDLRHLACEQHFNTERLSCVFAFAESSGGNACSTRSPPSTSSTRALRESIRRNSSRNVLRNLGHGARHFHASRAGTDHRESEPGSRASGAVSRLAGLATRSACSNASSTRRRISNVLQRLQPRHVRPIGHCQSSCAWRPLPRSNGHHTARARRFRAPPRAARHQCPPHHPVVVDVALAAKQEARRCSNGRRRKPGSGHLIRAAAETDGDWCGRSG